MANFPAEALADIQRGNQYLSNLNDDYLERLTIGCFNCEDETFKTLRETMLSLQYKVELDEYDEVALRNLDIMLYIIGDYQLQTSISVDAGANQSSETDETVIFTATVTLGSAPLQSILWEQVSGTPATLSGTTTATLQVTGFTLGESVFKVTATDTNEMVATDTVTLTGITDTQRIAYWGVGAVPNYAGIIASSQVAFNSGGSIIIPFNMTDADNLWFAYPQAEPTKNYYQDTLNPLNKGNMGTDQDYIGAPVIVTDLKVQNSYYPLIQPNPINFSTQ